ncbi:hypothetical protein LUZ60_002077 [Juncus effusus]|nr:hypothetical protein LUZ60_002077 [Juncus effusus]
MAGSAKRKNSKTLAAGKETLAPESEERGYSASAVDCASNVRFLSICCEGDQLEALLIKLQRSLELAKASNGEISDKIWMKLQFAIGINDVTRVLERMTLPDSNSNIKSNSNSNLKHDKFNKGNYRPLQAVILATDCNPKWLTKHIPQIAASRNVVVISLKDEKASSFRLGQLVKVKTALAIGIKERGSIINKAVEEFLCSCKAVDIL